MTTTTLLAGFDTIAPSSAPTTVAGTTNGSLGMGLYSYAVTYLTAYGETTISAASTAITTITGSINIVTIPVANDLNVIARNIYRTTSGGSSYLLLQNIPNNLPLSVPIVDIVADGSLGIAAPISNNAPSREILRGFVSRSQPSINAVTSGIVANAAGTQAAGTPITAEYNILSTVAGAGFSVTLPLLNVNLIGMRISIKNLGANAANVFPALGQQINALGANTAFSLAAAGIINLVATSSSLWIQF